MAKKVRGIKYLGGDTYLLDFQVGLLRQQIRIHATSMSEARAERDKRKVELRETVKRPQNMQERLNATFEEAWTKLEADLRTDKHSEKSVQRYKRIYETMFLDFRSTHFPGLKGPGQLKLPFLVEYKNHFVQDLKRDPAGGWRSELIYVKSMIRRLNKLGFCGKGLVDELCQIKRPIFEKKAYPDIPNGQLKTLFEFIKKDRLPYYYLLKFALITGRRIGEITSIEKDDIVWGGYIPIRINIRAQITKTKRDAPITQLSDELRQVIIQACRHSPRSRYVFSGSESDRCKPDRVREYLKRVSQNILSVGLSPHYFRHRFMTECGKAKVPFVDISNISGLKDPEVMQRHYAHSTKDGLASVFAATEL